MCKLVGADVDHVSRAIASDRRIGPSFLLPGVGYGWSRFRILRAVESVTAFQKTRLLTRMKGHFGSLNLKTIVADAWRWHAAHPHGFRVAAG